MSRRAGRPVLAMSFEQYARAVGARWTGRDAGLVVLLRPESTHLLARRIVQEYSSESALAPAMDFLAWQQTAGLGREGRPWTSPAGGGVYATMIRPLAVDLLQTLPLLVATALCQALNQHLGDRCRLKWPNDLLVEGRKLGGIVIDATSRGQGDAVTVISFGVNHSREIDVPGATSLEREATGRTELPDLAAQLVRAVDDALEPGVEIEVIVDRYQQLSVHRPGDTIRHRTGAVELEGEFRGFDRHGFLRLSSGDKELLLTAGEVSSGE